MLLEIAYYNDSGRLYDHDVVDAYSFAEAVDYVNLVYSKRNHKQIRCNHTTYAGVATVTHNKAKIAMIKMCYPKKLNAEHIREEMKTIPTYGD